MVWIVRFGLVKIVRQKSQFLENALHGYFIEFCKYFISYNFCFRYKGSVKNVKWSDVYSAFSSMGVDNILALLDLINSLPPTSVINETAFNQMKLMKSDRRHCLSNNHLNDCMLIRIESQAIKDFDPSDPIEKWMV